MVCVGRLLLSCKWCKSMTSQLPLCNVKRDHEYLPTYLPNNYLLWSPSKWTNRAEQYRTELIWFGSMDEIYSFICLLYTFVLPCSAHHDASSFASFLCAILCAVLVAVMQLRKLSGCGAFFPLRQHFTQVQSCRSSSSHQIHFHFVIVFLKKFPLLFFLKKRKPSVVVDSFNVFFAPFVLKFARLLLKLLVL